MNERYRGLSLMEWLLTNQVTVSKNSSRLGVKRSDWHGS